MICIIALIIFSILALFSARHRPLAKEAFDCVFRRVTFRKCRSGLDKRLKGQISGRLMKKNKHVGRFVFKYFEIISWIFLIILLLSLVQIGISVYNYSVYGNCNGPDETGFCIFDPLGTNQDGVSDTSMCVPSDSVPTMDGDLVAPSIKQASSNPKTGSGDAKVTVIEFGCFSCPNTAKQAPAVKKIIEHYGSDIQFIYVDFPLAQHPTAYDAAYAAQCVFEQDALLYWRYHFLLFDQHDVVTGENVTVVQDQLRSWAVELGVNAQTFDACLVDNKTSSSVDFDYELGVNAGVYGTPTFFINNESYVGVKKYRFLKSIIDDALSS